MKLSDIFSRRKGSPSAEQMPAAQNMASETANTQSKEEMNDIQTTTRVFNLVILDESGSMQSIYNQALSGANETIQTVKGAQKQFPNQKHSITFVTFDEGSRRENVRFIIDGVPADEVKTLGKSDYNPGGCTPLYDAMGISLTKLEKQTAEGDQVLVTVITDGLENASREYSGHAVKELVDRLKAKGWTFVFMGANMDSAEVARGMSIENSMNFDATEEGTQKMWCKVNSSRMSHYSKLERMRRTGMFERDFDFFDEKSKDSRITPDVITYLEPNEVFVFGSNIYGQHNGGAAGIAASNFGAVQGQAMGPQGRCFAIATHGTTLEAVKAQVDDFITYAQSHPDKVFLVSKIGCGNAGFTVEQIAPLFEAARNIQNICLPQEFWYVIGR